MGYRNCQFGMTKIYDFFNLKKCTVQDKHSKIKQIKFTNLQSNSDKLNIFTAKIVKIVRNSVKKS